MSVTDDLHGGGDHGGYHGDEHHDDDDLGVADEDSADLGLVDLGSTQIVPTGLEHDAHLVVGDPDEAMDQWHLQERDNTCAVAAQEFVLDDFTGIHHSEDELRQVAEEHGWYTPQGGTPVDDTGNILAYYGLDTEQQHGASFQQLETALAHGDGVIVGVESGKIWNPGFDPADSVTNYVGIPGQSADHAVEVIGVDHSDPAHPTVILNDSGAPDGRGERVPLATFLEAWQGSGNFLVTAHRP